MQNIQTHTNKKGSKERLFVMTQTQTICKFSGVIPFVKLQNDTETTVKRLKNDEK